MIAISYRREDSLTAAGRLYDRLQADFGKANVFMDFDSIPYGVDFREYIKQTVGRSSVLVAMIGPVWFGKGSQTTRRIDDPADFVRLEIGYALQRNIPVIPVLLNDTPMPKEEDLPSDIKELAFRNAVTLNLGIDFHHHADRLIVGINRLLFESARAAHESHKAAIPVEATPGPGAPSKSHPPEHSTAPEVTLPAQFHGPHLPEDSKSARETRSTFSQEPPPVKPSIPAGKTRAPPAPSPKQRWSTILHRPASLSNRKAIVFVAISVIAMLLVGILPLYFGSSRSKAWLLKQITAARTQNNFRAKEITNSPSDIPATPGSTASRALADSPYASSADLANYAMKLRNEALLKVEPQAFVPTASKPATARFAWKTNIVTMVFWIGEKTGKAELRAKSAWDTNWAGNYGGFDNPERSARRNFIPVAFVPRQNPFYCALPYNDVTHGQFKPEAPLVIPWFKQSYTEPGHSVCQHRWLAVRKGDRTCYAQWEDCGPFRVDHFQYVFQNERPKPNANHGAGLSVSPAVRDYLGLQPTDVTDWQFVEVRDVPPGPWRTYGENNHFVLARRQVEERMRSKESGDKPKN